MASAQPALDAAREAVDKLDKSAMTEMRAMPSPPAVVVRAMRATLILLRGERRSSELSWEGCKRALSKLDAFIRELKDLDATTLPTERLARARPLTEAADFDPDDVARRSFAAAAMARWCRAVVHYRDAFTEAEPLMRQLAEAEASRAAADRDAAAAQGRAAEAAARVNETRIDFARATASKAAAEAEAGALRAKLDVAARLVDGLSGERQRWGQRLATARARRQRVAGDSALAAAFVTYSGPLPSRARSELWHRGWCADLSRRGIAYSVGMTPMEALGVGSDEVARWAADGLPADTAALEAAAIVDRTLARAADTRAASLARLFSVRVGPGPPVRLHPAFRLVLVTASASPQLSADTLTALAVVDFSASPAAVEEAALSAVVSHEAPLVEAALSRLRREESDRIGMLQALEAILLDRLAALGLGDAAEEAGEPVAEEAAAPAAGAAGGGGSGGSAGGSAGDADASVGAQLLEDKALLDGLESTRTTLKALQDAERAAKRTLRALSRTRECLRPPEAPRPRSGARTATTSWPRSSPFRAAACRAW
ncbi:hypothetical protein FNF31_02171 [Cafeteria roenbergensis]|uniref:Dynein heavy chain coiled coil stalk domain-containing protein n=1 Tax=Cafeteria roenbergensis TaxID=33653 RepID=A0A5A8DHW1_CAFRO|nr:hypothetical protein FNF31_02171 [Cafeteria roenbergensis]